MRVKGQRNVVVMVAMTLRETHQMKMNFSVLPKLWTRQPTTRTNPHGDHTDPHVVPVTLHTSTRILRLPFRLGKVNDFDFQFLCFCSMIARDGLASRAHQRRSPQASTSASVARSRNRSSQSCVRSRDQCNADCPVLKSLQEVLSNPTKPPN